MTGGGPQTHVRTKGQNAQRAVSAHKRFPVVDTHQQQLAKCPKSTWCSEEQVAWVHTGGLTWSWNSSARPDACFCSTKEKCTLTVTAKQWRNREDPRKRWFRQLPGTSPQAPLSGQVTSSSSSSQPSWGVVLAALLSENPPGARYCESPASPRWEPKTVSNGGSKDFPGGPVAKTPNAGDLIPGQGTRSHLPQLKIPRASPKIPHVAMKMLHAATKTWYSHTHTQKTQQRRSSEV